jgi:RNA 2',3'-cyclic 3'-phosphodiesterase
MRLFVALPLPAGVVATLERIQQGVPGARWAPAENMHLTLRFIGDADGALFEDLVEALADVTMPAFALETTGVGHFETRRLPSMLWAGIRPSPALRHLQAKVERACLIAGLPRETRKFAPHITLARLGATDNERVFAFLRRYSLLDAGPVPVDGFNLYSSHLGKGTPFYRVEVEYLFEAPVE